MADAVEGTATPAQRLAGALTVGGFRTGSLIARMVPGIVAGGLRRPIGFGANVANPERRAMVERHLRRVNPHVVRWRLR